MGIITSLLDTDFYKFSMAQLILHRFSWVDVGYIFRCRNSPIIDWNEYVNEINTEVNDLCTLRFSNDELAYLSTIPVFKKDFIDHLRLLQLNRDHIQIWCDGTDLQVEISGNWFLTIWFEIPVLAIINEVYFSHQISEPDLEGSLNLLSQKLEMVKSIPDFRFADFGTRRRFSKQWQLRVLQYCQAELGPDQFTGTSNVFFAMQLGIKYSGTMAHELIQAGQAIGVRLDQSQVTMFQNWVDEYRGELGTVLSDTIGTDAFLVDFDKYFAKIFDAVRCDSGDPFEFGEKLITHYVHLNIDPMTKTVIFSNSLTFPLARELLDHFRGRIGVLFGIGTNLTNDIVDSSPLDIVIKMVEANGQPVAKITDSLDKGISRDPEYVKYLKSVFEQKVRKYSNS